MTEPKKRGRPAKTPAEPIKLDGYTITNVNGNYRIFSGKSLLYSTESESDLQSMCRLIEQRQK